MTDWSENSVLFCILNRIQEHARLHNSPAQCVFPAHLFIWSLPLSPDDRSSSPGHGFAGSSSPEPPSDSSSPPRYADMAPAHPANTFTILTLCLCAYIQVSLYKCLKETYHNLFISALTQSFFKTLGFVFQSPVLESQSVHLVLKEMGLLLMNLFG